MEVRNCGTKSSYLNRRHPSEALRKIAAVVARLKNLVFTASREPKFKVIQQAVEEKRLGSWEYTEITWLWEAPSEEDM